ncbi:carbon-nitrogen hydrolase family protein [Halotalea alkalilenta]|uniref:Aliphatic nitrilase n=1 Tax=Halotalea alkalilenta TaxID=376489 RepID=A0A172YI32_9GAMM|nr:carbon-nitrogen hydrolase family protein [Halotalea alkalilenta]ANF58857.1 aliphatic nitrilase [Halotalea alkalilenta]
MSSLPIFTAAACHAAPVFLDKAATTDKAIALIEEAAAHGATLVVFPESFIPAFPIWAALWPPIDNHDLFEHMVEQSLYVDGPEVAALQQTAARLGVNVSIGISERSHASVGCIWNANLVIDDQGRLVNHHRKLVPTFYEKLIWAPGDGEGLKVNPLSIGRLGALICGENTNPLARYALMAQGEQVHISAWPALWPTRRPSAGGNFDNLAANRIRASAHSFEAKAFGIVCAGYMDAPMRDFLVERDPAIAAVVDDTSRAESFFVDPTGRQLGPALSREEGILYAELDLNRCIEPKQFHDVTGYYQRYDVFSLSVERRRQRPVAWVDGEEPLAQPRDILNS